MIKPGDTVRYMGNLATVVYVYDTTASIRYVRKVRNVSVQMDVYLDDLVTEGIDAD